MPSLATEADTRRVLARAAEECAGRVASYGPGLPERLKSAASHGPAHGAASIAFVEVSKLSPDGLAEVPEAIATLGLPLVGLSLVSLDEASNLIDEKLHDGLPLVVLICSFAVFEFRSDRMVVREVRHGLTAADLQRHVGRALWAGPDLKELGAH